MNTPVRWAYMAGHGGEAVLDTLACEGCGYAVCSCPDGWECYTEDLSGGEVYTSYRKDGAVVWNFSMERPPAWRWGYDPEGGCVCCMPDEAKPTKVEAMAAAMNKAKVQ